MLFAIFEKSINALTAFNYHSDACCAELAGKTIAIAITFPVTGIVFHFGEQVTISHGRPEQFDLLLEGSLYSLIKLQTTNRLTNVPDLKITGDLTLARSFGELLKLSNIDWQALLAAGVGDIAAYNLSQWWCARVRDLKAMRQAWQRNVTSYLQDETRSLPSALEAESFYQEIDELRDAAARVDARLAALEMSRDNS